MRAVPGVLSRSLALLLTATSVGCCQWKSQKRPAPPGSVEGWKRFSAGGATVVGEFLLKKGESVENGAVGIRVVDVTPARCNTIFAEPGNPKAAVVFYRVGDGRRLAEVADTTGWSEVAGAEAYGFDGIFIHAINAEDGWVYFDLRE